MISPLPDSAATGLLPPAAPSRREEELSDRALPRPPRDADLPPADPARRPAHPRNAGSDGATEPAGEEGKAIRPWRMPRVW
ncbi:MAG: hypothetical protein AB1726_07125 [Planctomycetota bacterium]